VLALGIAISFLASWWVGVRTLVFEPA
jgi:hypothetical protein